MTRPCENTCRGYFCTQPLGHPGLHEAHGVDGRALQHWNTHTVWLRPAGNAVIRMARHPDRKAG